MLNFKSTANWAIGGVIVMVEVPSDPSASLAYWVNHGGFPRAANFIQKYGPTYIPHYFVPLLVLALAANLAWPLIARLFRLIKPLKPMEIGAPDMPIHQVIHYIVNDSIAKLRDRPVGYDEELVSLINWSGIEHQDALEQVRQKATLGDLRLWGMPQIGEPSAKTFDDVFHEIPTNYWQQGRLNVLFCFHNTEEPQSKIPGDWRQENPYTHIMASRSQVLKIWPKKSWFRRSRDKIKNTPRKTYWSQNVH